jgi:hypothetical protein
MSDLPIQEPIKSLPELYQRLLALQQAGAHLITPFMIQDIPAKHVPVLIPIPVDPDPKKDDVYPVGNEKYALGRNPLRRIEQALGIDWDLRPGMTGRVDNGSNPDYIHYKAIGLCPMPDGTKKTIVGEKEIRVDLLMEEAVAKYRKKAVGYQRDTGPTGQDFRRTFPTPDNVEEYVQEKARHEILQIKKHLLPRAATGAKCIAVKSLGVREAYTLEELKHPFLVLKIQPRLDMNDPEDAALIRAQALGMVETLYSGRLQLPSAKELPAIECQASPDSAPLPSALSPATATTPAPQATSAPTQPASQPPQPTTAPAQAATSTLPDMLSDSLRADFRSMAAQDQAVQLARMVKLTDPARANAYTADRISRWSERARLNFYDEQTRKLAAQKVGAA